jgi:hypothetical protein
MKTLHPTPLQAADGGSHPLHSIAWSGEPILDACTVQSEYGHLLILTVDGALHGIDLDTGVSVELCKVTLPALPDDDNTSGNSYFGAARHRLHASSDGRHAAIVVDWGRHGMVVDVLSGAVTMNLDGGDYHEETVPFSACFLRHQGRDVLVHRTAWNRLDAADPATGRSLTERHIAAGETGAERPAHYLDYFHGQLRPSPDGSRMFDDGWVWQPVSIPLSWSVTDWLSANPWESEDGASMVRLAMRDDWTTPACWISAHQVALWGLGDWSEDEGEETGQGPGVRILDAAQDDEPSPDSRWPMEEIGAQQRVLDLFSDGSRLYVATETGTTAWDLASRAQIATWPGFTARLFDPARHALVGFGRDSIVELPLP